MVSSCRALRFLCRIWFIARRLGSGLGLLVYRVTFGLLLPYAWPFAVRMLRSPCLQHNGPTPLYALFACCIPLKRLRSSLGSDDAGGSSRACAGWVYSPWFMRVRGILVAGFAHAGSWFRGSAALARCATFHCLLNSFTSPRLRGAPLFHRSLPPVFRGLFNNTRTVLLPRGCARRCVAVLATISTVLPATVWFAAHDDALPCAAQYLVRSLRLHSAVRFHAVRVALLSRWGRHYAPLP